MKMAAAVAEATQAAAGTVTSQLSLQTATTALQIA